MKHLLTRIPVFTRTGASEADPEFIAARLLEKSVKGYLFPLTVVGKDPERPSETALPDP